MYWFALAIVDMGWFFKSFGTRLAVHTPVPLTIDVQDLWAYVAAIAALLSVASYIAVKIRSQKDRKKQADIILDAEAREMARKEGHDVVPSGIPTVDYLLNGGFPKKSASLLTAPACDERDMIMRRFLEYTVRSGGRGIYLGQDASRVGDLLASHEPRLSALIVSGAQSGQRKPNVHFTEKIENLTALNIDLASEMKAGNMAGSKVLYIDLLDDLLLVHKMNVTRKWLSQLLQRTKDLDYTILATLNSQMHPQPELQAMIDLFDGHLEILEREVEGNPRMVIRVRKMFGTKFLPTEALLNRDRLMN